MAVAAVGAGDLLVARVEILVAFSDEELGFSLFEVVLFHDGLEAHRVGRVDEDVEACLSVAQDVVGAAADEDARAAGGETAHGLALEEDDAVREVVVADGAELLGADVQVTAADLLGVFRFVEEVFGEARFLDDVIDEVAVVAGDAVVRGDFLRERGTAAAVFAADGDDDFLFCVFHAIHLSFEVVYPCIHRTKKSCCGSTGVVLPQQLLC